MSNFKVFNGFGIKPSKSYAAAGWDFYVPNITNDTQKLRAYESFNKSYKKTDRELNLILERLKKELYAQDKEELYNIHNIIIYNNVFCPKVYIFLYEILKTPEKHGKISI